jgi:hypothetical protein
MVSCHLVGDCLCRCLCVRVYVCASVCVGVSEYVCVVRCTQHSRLFGYRLLPAARVTDTITWQVMTVLQDTEEHVSRDGAAGPKGWARCSPRHQRCCLQDGGLWTADPSGNAAPCCGGHYGRAWQSAYNAGMLFEQTAHTMQAVIHAASACSLDSRVVIVGVFLACRTCSSVPALSPSQLLQARNGGP